MRNHSGWRCGEHPKNLLGEPLGGSGNQPNRSTPHRGLRQRPPVRSRPILDGNAVEPALAHLKRFAYVVPLHAFLPEAPQIEKEQRNGTLPNLSRIGS